MTNSSYLIFGGSGFIGSHLVRELKQLGVDNITVADIVPPQGEIFSGTNFVYCDVRSPIQCANISTSAVIIHLAALCKEPGYDWDEYFKTNYSGTLNICEFAERTGINHIVFTSTMMVFRAGDRRYREDDLTSPDTAYGISKLLAELALNEWSGKSADRHLNIVRPGVVFGKGEKGNFTKLYYALKKSRFAYIGRRDTVKGCIYVKDLVGFLIFLSYTPQEKKLFNFVYPDPITIEDICTAMCSEFGFTKQIPVVPYSLALFAGYIFEILSLFGLKTSIHHRRVQKLFFSTNISADRAMSTGFPLKYTLQDALKDWRRDCMPEDVH